MSDTPAEPSLDTLIDDFAGRWRAGECPSVGDYARRHPAHADDLREVLGAVAHLERARRDAAPPPTEPVGSDLLEQLDRLGEYTIVRELGRGGMGVVYEAVQGPLGRRVALKVGTRRLLADDRARERFRREARAAARLHHTNIVTVFDFGETGGQGYLVMQHIDGRPLDRLARPSLPPAERLTPAQVARVGVQVADALGYAHAHGVLHRDIKPSNVLLDADGTAWVTDFGVAKVLGDDTLTAAGEVVGTLRYMPPEQFAGGGDGRADVYGLGVTLYELLALRPAFPDQATPQALVRLVTEADPERPRRLNPAVPYDLETVVLKAMARDPAKRYQTPGDLAADLRRFLDDRPVLARRAGPTELALRWARRHPTAAAAAALVAAMLVGVTAVSLAYSAETAEANRQLEVALRDQTRQRERSEETAALALAALNRTYERFAPARLVAAPPAADAYDPPRAAALPPEAVSLLEDLLGTYQGIARAGEPFDALAGCVAEANHRIGDLCRRLGRLDEAERAYAAAAAGYGRVSAVGDVAAAQVRLARSANERGRVLRLLHRVDEARADHERALRALDVAAGDRPEAVYETASACQALGERDRVAAPAAPQAPGSGRPPRPPADPREVWTRRAIGLLEPLAAAYPGAPEYRHLLARCYQNVRAVRPGDPESGGVESVRLLRRLAAEHPRVPDYRAELCEALARTGRPAGVGGPANEARARAWLDEGVAAAADLARDFPGVPAYAAARARYLDKQAQRPLARGDAAAAEAGLRQAEAVVSDLTARSPGVPSYQLTHAAVEQSVARLHSARKEWPAAVAAQAAAARRTEAVWQGEQRLPGLREMLAKTYRQLADYHREAGESREAAVAGKMADDLSTSGP